MKIMKKQDIKIYSTNLESKAMPQATAIEEAVLGAILLEHEALDKVIDILVPEVFYSPANQIIFGAIMELSRNKKPIDLLTVSEQIKSEGHLEIVGGSYYISQLTQRVASSANVEYHSRILLQTHMKRKLITIGTQVANNSFEDGTDVFEELDNLKAEITQVESLIGTYQQNIDIKTITSRVGDAILNETPESMRASSFKWGLSDLDKLCPIRKPYFYVVGGRPSHGKTSIIKLVLKTNALDSDERCLVFSLEMTADQLIEDLVSQMTLIDSFRIRSRDLTGDEKHRILDALDKINNNLIIDDTPGITYQMINKRIKAERKKGKIDIVIIDYLQLMRVERWQEKGRTEEGILSVICNELPNIAKEENCAMILLSQLGREVDKRSPPSPIMSDLKGSGSIEANAVAIILLYRPEVYGITVDGEGNDLNGVAEIKVAKFRFGATGKIHARFLHQFTMFCDMNKGDYLNPNANFLK